MERFSKTEKKMNYGTIKNCDIANGMGVRVSLFVSGCTNKCEGCFQPETWSFDYGQPFSAEAEERILGLLEPFYIDGLTLLGGEPFEPANQKELLPFLKRVRAEFPNKNVWCFTGFTYEELKNEGSYCRTEYTDEMLSLIDVLVDGRFEKDKKNIKLRFRGSENQRIIDLNLTREYGNLTLWDEAETTSSLRLKSE